MHLKKVAAFTHGKAGSFRTHLHVKRLTISLGSMRASMMTFLESRGKELKGGWGGKERTSLVLIHDGQGKELLKVLRYQSSCSPGDLP